jgi:hypothetical protein
MTASTELDLGKARPREHLACSAVIAGPRRGQRRREGSCSIQFARDAARTATQRIIVAQSARVYEHA